MVEINPDGVRKVGNELYPALADIYKDTAKNVTEAGDLRVPNQESLQATLEEYAETIADFLKVSEASLRFCGEALVEMTDNLQNVDEDSAESIATPVEGMPTESGNDPTR